MLIDELEALAKRHGALSYRNRADTQNPAFGFSVAGLESLLAEVRKDDDALIRQMLDFAELVKRGLEQGTVKAQPIIEIDDDAPDLVIKTLHGEATSAITAATARLEKAP